MIRLALLWVLFFIPQFLISIFCKLTAPVVALFVTKELRTDRVKRLGNQVLTFDREYIIKPLRWWQTFDNAVDEYWWGQFNGQSYFRFMREATQDQYNRSAFVRWFCRVTWMQRNAAYGFAQYLFGRPGGVELYRKQYGDPSSRFSLTFIRRKCSWQLYGKHPLIGNYYNNVNFGWKPHDGFDRVMFAGRIIGLRSYK